MRINELVIITVMTGVVKHRALTRLLTWEQGQVLRTCKPPLVSPIDTSPRLDLCGQEGPQSHYLLFVHLTEMLKDKNKPVMPARAKGPRGRKRRPGEAEEMADAELMASTLETCKGLLRSILTYWGPVIPGPDPTQEPVDSASPESDAPGPVYAAASLAVSWVLRSVAEHPLSRAEAAGLIGWLKSHILPHPVVVADLLKDGAVRSSIFKLYSRLCGAEGLAGPAQEVACLFNTVMLQLVAAQGRAGSPFHPAMEALSLSSLSEKDEATRGKAGSFVGG